MDMSKAILVAFALALAIALTESLDFDERDLASEENLWDLYERWRSQHTVSRDLEEKAIRFNVFKANVMHVHKVNQLNRPFKLELNKFADMTTHEFASSYGGSKVKHYRMLRGSRRATGNFSHGKTVSIPPSIDWRKIGAVTAVKDQGRCGSCWAFSTIVGVEGINYIKTKQLVSLSEQELVDCNSKNSGCNGGLMDDAFEFIKDNHGITTEKNYPYLAKDESCNRAEMRNSPLVAIDGYEDVPESNEDALMKAVANQPVSVAMDARSQDLQFYKEGVFNGDCGKELDHGVAIVGYGTTLEGTKYWIVKNSWGPEWGEKGYVRIERGIPRKEGQCGIAMEASYPIKLSSNNPVGTTLKDEL